MLIMMEGSKVSPIPIKILAIISYLGFASTIIIALVSLFAGSMISSLLAFLLVLLGLVELWIANGLWKGKDYAYFTELLSIMFGIIYAIIMISLKNFEQFASLIFLVIIAAYLLYNKRVLSFFGFDPLIKPKGIIKRFWAFLKEDTWQSWLVSLILIIIIIRFIFFPLLSFATGTALPLVVVESCSMYHETDFSDWWAKNAAYYEAKNISKEDFAKYSLANGMNKGDVIFVLGDKTPEKGDIIIFAPNQGSTARNPIIHRIITNNPLGTKGDHNIDQLRPGNNPGAIDETSIQQQQIIGKAVFKVPYIGWIKLFFYEILGKSAQPGFCK